MILWITHHFKDSSIIKCLHAAPLNAASSFINKERSASPPVINHALRERNADPLYSFIVIYDPVLNAVKFT